MSEPECKHDTNSADVLVKVAFKLPDDCSVDRETMWAEHINGDTFRLRNVPFWAFGFSEQDIVTAVEDDGWLTVTGVARRGGHSTYHLILPENTTEEQFLKDWKALASLGCTYERASRRLVGVDVPPDTDVYAVYDVLEQGEISHIWQFEEGHCGHPLRKR